MIESKEKITRTPGCLYFVGKDGYVYSTPRKGKKGKKMKVSKMAIKRMPGKLYYLGKSGCVESSPIKKRAKKRLRA